MIRQFGLPDLNRNSPVHRLIVVKLTKLVKVIGCGSALVKYNSRIRVRQTYLSSLR